MLYHNVVPRARPLRAPPARGGGSMRLRGWSLCLLLAACDSHDSASDAAASTMASRGRLLLAQYQCGSCHVIPEVAAARGGVGPTLAAFGRRSYIAGHIPNNPDALVRWIVNPAALVPDTVMPSMGVSQQDARAMAAFLNSLR